MAEFHVPFPALAFRTGMILLFAGCGMLLTGWRADIGAVCLIVFTLTATAIYHRFWTRAGPGPASGEPQCPYFRRRRPAAVAAERALTPLEDSRKHS